VGKLRSSAEVAFSKGDVDQAIRLWAEVIGLEPNNEANYYKRFRVYLRQQKFKEALSDLSSALAIKPEYEAVLVQRAKLQLKLGKCNEAELDFENLRK
jgi:tetratricopeptide (TPR) repeat protein